MGTRYSNKYHVDFFATLHEKGTVDGLGGTVKYCVWRFVKPGANTPLDAIIYLEIARQQNPSINIFFISYAKQSKIALY